MDKKIRHRVCKFSECREMFRPERYGQVCCSVDHAISHAKELEEKKRNREWKARKSEMKEKVKKLGDYKKELQILINELVREIDKGYECISCGNSNNVKFNAGHLHSVGSNPQLRYHLMNIFKQCEHCNSYLSGNILGYLSGIKETFGRYVLEEVQNTLKSEISARKWTKEELQQAKKVVKEWINDVRGMDLICTPEERISFRRKANKEIGLY